MKCLWRATAAKYSSWLSSIRSDRTRRSATERPASSTNSPGSVCQPPSQCWNARGASGMSITISSPASASITAKPASQRSGRSIALSGRDA